MVDTLLVCLKIAAGILVLFATLPPLAFAIMKFGVAGFYRGRYISRLIEKEKE